ncbi:MAG: glycosyltransferase family 39 protein [Bryobacteraceae bacterium]|jgi:4-amino-4-deoxy-L-arabinose transferase-like glycosyltransferase
MSTVAVADSSIAVHRTAAEVLFRRILFAAAVVAAIGLLCHFAMLAWAGNEFTQPESIVAAQSTMLARDGTLYYPLDRYPYTVCAYMPIYYVLDAGLIGIGLPAFTAGRSISFAALLGIFALCWRMLMLYTGDRYVAGTGTLLCASTSVLLAWGTVGQVDTLALFFALAAFYCYSRYSIRGENALLAAGALAAAALFTKQTMVACPAAIFVLLWFGRRRVALQFGVGLAAVVLALVAALNAATHGRLLTDTVLANLNPFAWEKVSQHVHYILIAAGELVVIALAGARRALRGPGKGLFLYLGLAAAVLAGTAPKIGSDSNYQIESTVLLILCASVALHALNFFPLLFGTSRTWITLLQLPLALHLILNYRITGPFLLLRLAREQRARQQVAALQPFAGGRGRILSTDMNALVHLRGRVEVEPLIYKLLVRAGRVDPEPVRRDLAGQVFSTVILYHDVSRPADPDLEFPTLPERQLAEIRRHYRLAAHIPGPWLDGVYVYKPAAERPR